MDIYNASFFTVAQMGGLYQFKQKLERENLLLSDIIDVPDADNMSVLEHAIAGMKFDIANSLLDNGAKVNFLTKDGYNELHFIAANLRAPHALPTAKRLIGMGVDLDQKDKKYQNTAFLTLLLESFKLSPYDSDLILMCLSRKPDIYLKNKAGISAFTVISTRGTDKIKNALKEIYG